ncbi:MAG: glutamate--tRNA ligase [Firmicutes bacterium]|nr:glutamate--tRNA ligase [Bacillota bacterium]
MSDIRVRFAPSPTGYLHIGGARTALYNWLFARHYGGKFLLRIEDTDRNRYVPDALADITASLRWLGMDWDEGPEVGGEYGPYFQSERLEYYRNYAEQLIAAGKAYRCYCTPERLEELRKEQEAAKAPSGYDRFCLELTSARRRELETAGARYVVRFKIPQGRTIVHDQLRGELEFDNQTMDDFVLLKSDGFPTYHLANIVDDHLMQISHVMRGDEWLISTPRHVLLYRALGWEAPQFAHLPVFLAPSGGGKLSKRHGATSVREYREKGYLPEAMINFLLLLGWNPGTEQELFTLEEAAKAFTMERINKSPVAFATDKLDWFNGVYIRKLSSEELAKRCLPYLQQAGLLGEPCPPERFAYLVKVMPLIRERLKSIPEVVDLAGYFLRDEIPVPEKAILVPKKSDPALTLQILKNSYQVFKMVGDDFKEADLEAGLRGLAQNMGLHDGQVFMPVRAAISGRTATPGIFETLHVLGKEKVLKRLENAIGAFTTAE